MDQQAYKGMETAWCPGCGNFGILNAVKQALLELEKKPQEIMLFSGIGQAAKLPHYMRGHVFNGLHGRALPAAQAAKLANHRLTVLAFGGDGDMYGEGGNHFLHAIRRNVDITVLVHDNRIYGLTKGQASPTTDLGVKTKVQTEGVINGPLNPLALAISQHCAFVARGFSGSIEHLTTMIKAGIAHPGFSYIEVMQPCVSFNHINTHAWYKERIYDVAQDGKHDPTNYLSALEKAEEWGSRIPLGVIYRNDRPAYDSLCGALKNGPLVDQVFRPELIAQFIRHY
ncbi:MAG: 2-oxoacid:ferredoxin oxidoreductase subunit beta [Candidatus Firestonebacteria bacterium]|nr:2-oxoacid:ferredoxin oxidoreductase subunit beta [Candidatus Firestonebacteria bacterium]